MSLRVLRSQTGDGQEFTSAERSQKCRYNRQGPAVCLGGSR